MNVTKLILPAVVFLVSACAARPDKESLSAFDLNLTHPSPHANYIRVAPVAGGPGLPLPEHVLTPAFSAYLRQHTGCVRDASRPAAVLGNRAVPAGYMVPVICP